MVQTWAPLFLYFSFSLKTMRGIYHIMPTLWRAKEGSESALVVPHGGWPAAKRIWGGLTHSRSLSPSSLL